MVWSHVTYIDPRIARQDYRSSRIGAGTEYALRRLLLKLGLPLGRDVMLPPTGISESDRRLSMRMQGKIEAPLGTADNFMPLAARGRKSNVLPREETIQNDIEALSSSYPHLKGRRAGEYLDISLRAFGIARG